MTLKLSEIEAPLDDVEFPNGSVHQPVPFGKDEYRLWREAKQETDSDKKDEIMLQILRACYPTATDEDFNTCTVRMFAAMIAHAMRRIDTATTALKNGVAVAPVPEVPPQAVTTPSSPKKNGNTSPSRSRKRSDKSGGASITASPTDGPSSSGSATTTSKNPDESTAFSVSWKTSTAPPSQAAL